MVAPIPTPIDKRQLIIQIKDDRDGCQAVVPVHPSVFSLPDDVLADETIARNALSAAREQFKKEANDYVESLIADKYPLHPSLRLNEFRHFNPKWRFKFSNYNRLAKVVWERDGEEPYEMLLCPYVIISSRIRLEESPHRQARIEELEIAPNVSIMYGTTEEEDFLLLPREMMLEYEQRNTLAGIIRKDDEFGQEVTVSALCSSYTLNVPQALLLRNWAVEYNNQLLKKI